MWSDISDFFFFRFNKTKYFRLRLSYEVKQERPESDLDQKDED